MLEAAWKSRTDDVRDLWRALAQLAVGLTHVQRGNATGAAALLRRAADGLAPYAGTAPYDIDVDRLRDSATSMARNVEKSGTDIVDITTVRLRG